MNPSQVDAASGPAISDPNSIVGNQAQAPLLAPMIAPAPYGPPPGLFAPAATPGIQQHPPPQAAPHPHHWPAAHRHVNPQAGEFNPNASGVHITYNIAAPTQTFQQANLHAFAAAGFAAHLKMQENRNGPIPNSLEAYKKLFEKELAAISQQQQPLPMVYPGFPQPVINVIQGAHCCVYNTQPGGYSASHGHPMMAPNHGIHAQWSQGQQQAFPPTRAPFPQVVPGGADLPNRTTCQDTAEAQTTAQPDNLNSIAAQPQQVVPLPSSTAPRFGLQNLPVSSSTNQLKGTAASVYSTNDPSSPTGSLAVAPGMETKDMETKDVADTGSSDQMEEAPEDLRQDEVGEEIIGNLGGEVEKEKAGDAEHQRENDKEVLMDDSADQSEHDVPEIEGKAEEDEEKPKSATPPAPENSNTDTSDASATGSSTSALAYSQSPNTDDAHTQPDKLGNNSVEDKDMRSEDDEEIDEQSEEGAESHETDLMQKARSAAIASKKAGLIEGVSEATRLAFAPVVAKKMAVQTAKRTKSFSASTLSGSNPSTSRVPSSQPSTSGFAGTRRPIKQTIVRTPTEQSGSQNDIDSEVVRLMGQQKEFLADLSIITDVGSKEFVDVFKNGEHCIKNLKIPLKSYSDGTDFLQKLGDFRYPVLFENKEGLGMKIPEKLRLETMGQVFNLDRNVTVIESYASNEFTMTIRDVLNTMLSSEHRGPPLNVLSLEFSLIKDIKFKRPTFVNDHSIVSAVEIELRSAKEKLKTELSAAQNSGDSAKVTALKDQLKKINFRIKSIPRLEKFLLISMKDSYTDVHVDPSGSSVFYHVIQGRKIFYIAECTKENLAVYEKYETKKGEKDWICDEILGEFQRLEIHAGQTAMIPAGWLHSVYTPEDSLVIGGNFLMDRFIPMQFEITRIEEEALKAEKIKISNMFPRFYDVMWAHADLVMPGKLKNHECPEYIIEGVKEILKMDSEKKKLNLKNKSWYTPEEKKSIQDRLATALADCLKKRKAVKTQAEIDENLEVEEDKDIEQRQEPAAQLDKLPTTKTTTRQGRKRQALAAPEGNQPGPSHAPSNMGVQETENIPDVPPKKRYPTRK